MLEIITFTGVDAHTDLEEVREIAREYPRAEFAVLFGSQTWGDNPIFPPVETVRALRKTQGVNTALHLCGRYARKAAGEEPMGLGLKHLARGFGRIQVNLHGDEQDPRRIEIAIPAIKQFAEQAGTGSVILQHRGPWSETPVDHPMIEYLFDLSEGRGEEGFEHWPDPPGDRRAGYAGGLGPHNIRMALEFAERHPEARIWFDMERNIRDQNYRLDLDRVREVCQMAFARQDG